MSTRARTGSSSAISRLGEERQRRADHHAGHDAEQRQRRELQEIGRRTPAARARPGTSWWRWCAAGRQGSSRSHCRRRRRPPAARTSRPGSRNSVSRSSQNCRPPPASPSPLTRQPASGNLALMRLIASTSERARRQAQAIFPGEQAALLHQARFGDRRPQGSSGAGRGSRRRSRRDRARARSPPRISTVASPTFSLSPSGGVHALQRRLLDHRAPHAVALGQRIGERAAALRARRCRRADRPARPP